MGRPAQFSLRTTLGALRCFEIAKQMSFAVVVETLWPGHAIFVHVPQWDDSKPASLAAIVTTA